MSIHANIQRSFLTGWTVATMIGLVLGWVAATMLLIGWANGGITESLSAAIGRYAAAMASYALSGALLGVLVGVGQWFMLRRRLHEAGWWSVASTFGGAVGGAATIAVNLQLPPLQQTLEQDVCTGPAHRPDWWGGRRSGAVGCAAPSGRWRGGVGRYQYSRLGAECSALPGQPAAV
ncbi:MAG: hypothetical protein HC876_09020 [Chloroflexaceae bacterium]|nr:hypothetical protein [Chloroflexaceae bacterium]